VTRAEGSSDRFTSEAWLGQAKSLIRHARFRDAERLLLSRFEAGVRAADSEEALYMLAVARRYGGDVPAALETIESLIARNPHNARAHQERGHALTALGRDGDAIAAYERAVRRNPALAASWRALISFYERSGRVRDADLARRQHGFLAAQPAELQSAGSYINEGDLDQAERLCRRFLQRNKHHVEGMRLLAEIGVRRKIYDDAEFLLETCLELQPDYMPARVDYMNVLVKRARFEKACEQAERLLASRPEDPRIETTLAMIYVGLGRVDEGIALYRKILREHPDRPSVHVLLGHARKTVGDLDGAIASYQRAYEIKPDYGDAFWSLANTKTYRFSDAELAQVREQERAGEVSTEDRIHLCFAAGKALEDRGDYDASFEYYERGNALKRESLRYDARATTMQVDRQIAICTRALFEARSGAGCPAPDAIFIVGLPRAGSTLLEQILASHSMVDGTMELHDVLALVRRLRGRVGAAASRYPEILHELDDEYFRRFGERYLADTRVYRGGAPLFIDKMPNNFLHLGLIKLILPNAKVIDARRDAMACCFSNFKQLFGEGQDFTYGLREVGAYYRDYVRLMDHWDDVLPGFVLRVMHEDVVGDLEGQVRRMLEFCGLPFEERCLRYWETERSVKTPSSEQVRQPIFTSGLDQWRNYVRHLGPLEEALGEDVLARHAS